MLIVFAQIFGDPHELNGGTPLEFLPHPIGEIIRLFLLAASATLIGYIVFGFVTNPAMKRLPKIRKFAWLSVALFVLRSVKLQVTNFDHHIDLETVILVLPATVLALIAIRDVVKHQDEGSLGYEPQLRRP